MPNKRLKAGVAEIEITPSGKVELAAEFQPRQAEGIGAPLYAKALVLSNEAETLGIITLDLLGLNPASAAELEMLISQRTGIMPEALVIICSRTRAAPCTTPVIGVTNMDQVYLKTLLERVPGCVEQALKSRQEASLGAGEATLPHLVYNHRLMTRNYKAISAWLGIPPNEVLAPEGPTDPSFNVLTLLDQRGFPLCLLWNFSADFHFPLDHLISSGLPGLVQETVDERLGRHVPLLYLPGCGGNISFTWDLDKSCEAVSSAVISVYLESPCDPTITLGYAAERMVLPIQDYSQLWQEADIELKYPQALETYRQELASFQQTGELAVPAQVKVFRLGSFGLVGLPGMPFVEFALQIKQESAFTRTFVVGNAGGDVGFVVPRKSFEGGGYETWLARSAQIGPGGGEFMAWVASQMLAELSKPQ